MPALTSWNGRLIGCWTGMEQEQHMNIAHSESKETSGVSTRARSAAATKSAGAPVSAMVFDGHSSVVTISQPLPPMPAGVTIEFWAVAPTTCPALDVFAAWKADGSRVLNIHFPWSDGGIYWDAGSEGWDRIHHAAETGEYKGAWTHWAFVKDVAAGEMGVFRNRALWHKDGGRTKPLADGVLAIIGAYVDGNYKWTGRSPSSASGTGRHCGRDCRRPESTPDGPGAGAGRLLAPEPDRYR